MNLRRKVNKALVCHRCGHKTTVLELDEDTTDMFHMNNKRLIVFAWECSRCGEDCSAKIKLDKKN